MTKRQQALMNKIQTASFAVTEANLYLDTHPTCAEGLEYFRRHKEMYEKAVKEYETQYGPITAAASPASKKWEWVTKPFPWELSENERSDD